MSPQREAITLPTAMFRVLGAAGLITVALDAERSGLRPQKVLGAGGLATPEARAAAVTAAATRMAVGSAAPTGMWFRRCEGFFASSSAVAAAASESGFGAASGVLLSAEEGVVSSRAAAARGGNAGSGA